MTASTELDVTDFFCGMGGSSTGLRAAGWKVRLAANHWRTAIDTHSANHPDTEHLCADLQAIDLRYLPRTRALWASPICTEVSPAGGRRKRDRGGQAGPTLFEEYGHVPSEAFERTRVTFWEVIRACEVHRYEMVMIENVTEAAEWELFDTWLAGMTQLGYEVQFISVSAAHIGGATNPHAPQWRDRLYMVFNRKGIRRPDVEPRPLTWCLKCGADVAAVQWWKRPGRHIGKYGRQYVYVCPVGNHGQIEPYVAPAAAAIDWTDLGIRIGDRAELGMRPLSAGTMKRIEMGLRMISDPVLVAAAGNTYDAASGKDGNYLRATDPNGWPLPAQVTSAQSGIASSFVMATNHDSGPRAFDPEVAPLPTRSTKNGEGLVAAEPFVTMLRRNGRATPIGDPLQTFLGRRLSPRTHRACGRQPMPALVTTTRPMLVVPYRKGVKPHPLTEPLSTQTTHAQHGVMSGLSVEDCYFRMLHPRESANAQRFPTDYVITGNRGEQQMQAGNAVAVNVAQWIGSAVAAALDS